MEPEASLLKIFGGIERQIRSIMNASRADSSAAVKTKQLIVHDLELTHKSLHDYEGEEDARTQSGLLPMAIEQLDILRKNILEASQHDIFGAVDVAQLTASIDQLIERLR